MFIITVARGIDPVTEERYPPFTLRLTLNTALILLAEKPCAYFYHHSSSPILYLVSLVEDVFLLVANYLLWAHWLGKSPSLKKAGRVLFSASLFLCGTIAFLYTLFLEDILHFPVNLFGITWNNVTFFAEYFLNGKVLAGLVLGGVALVYLSTVFPRRGRYEKLLPGLSLTVAILFVPTLFKPGLNPLVFSLQTQVALALRANRDVVKLTKAVPDGGKAQRFRHLDKGFAGIPVLPVRYDRIIVLVMEGIGSEDFARYSQADDSSFYARYRPNIFVYENYHTLNLDSYTSLIAMLNSIFVPYQAYVNEKGYAFVNRRNNLTRFFHANGFTTFFLTSYGRQQERFVPNAGEWTKRRYEDIAAGMSRYACITSSKVENACEDLAVFDDLVAILKTNPKAFVFQEMVYGHTTEWQSKTGIGTLDYYNRYFIKIVEALVSNQLLDKTLLVVASDHGPRSDASLPRNYQIPLLFFASDIRGGKSDAFLSHLDFKDLLLEFIAQQKCSCGQDPVLTVGHSGEYVYGRISADGKYVFVNNRMRHAESNAAADEIKAVNRDFQDYLHYFEYLRLSTE